MCECSWSTTTFSRTLKRKLWLDTDRYYFMLSLSRVGFFNRVKTRADLKCEGKEPSESDKLTVNVICIIIMSIQSYTKLVGIKSKFDDLHGTSRTRWHTSLAVTLVTFSKTFLVSGRLSTRKCESQGKQEWITQTLFMKKQLKVLASNNRYIIRKM